MTPVRLLLSARGAALILLLLLLILLEPLGTNCKNIDLFQPMNRNLKRVVTYNWVKRSDDTTTTTTTSSESQPAEEKQSEGDQSEETASGEPEEASESTSSESEENGDESETAEGGEEAAGGSPPPAPEVAQAAPASETPAAEKAAPSARPDLPSGLINTNPEPVVPESIETAEPTQQQQPQKEESPLKEKLPEVQQQSSSAPELPAAAAAEPIQQAELKPEPKLEPELKPEPEVKPEPKPEVESSPSVDKVESGQEISAKNSLNDVATNMEAEKEKSANEIQETPTAPLPEKQPDVEAPKPVLQEEEEGIKPAPVLEKPTEENPAKEKPAEQRLQPIGEKRIVPEVALVRQALNSTFLAGAPITSFSAIESEERWSYKIDKESCEPLDIKVPSTILRMTIDRIFATLNSANCSAGLKLQPLINNQINGHVMEVSSMPIEAQQLIWARETLVKCRKGGEQEEEGEGEKLRKFELIFQQEFNDQRLKSKWRHHPRLQPDDIPLSSSFNLIASSSRSSSFPEIKKNELTKFAGRLSKRCQRFKLEGGEFYLDLLELKTEVRFSIQLKPYSETNYAASDKYGGQIRMSNFKVKSLFLDHSLDVMSLNYQKRRNKNMKDEASYQERVGVSSGLSQKNQAPERDQARAQPTVQVLHLNNSHFRRNNWLLELYGNWLKQAYRKQLVELVNSRMLLSQMNSCFGEQNK